METSFGHYYVNAGKVQYHDMLRFRRIVRGFYISELKHLYSPSNFLEHWYSLSLTQIVK